MTASVRHRLPGGVAAPDGRGAVAGRILGETARLEDVMIVLGVILLVIGLVAGISILWTIGVVLVVIGAILWILGAVGHAVGGRRHYW
ncbi:hypothetical protein GCM10010433_51610 [Streptomyces pulveraceus]